LSLELGVFYLITRKGGRMRLTCKRCGSEVKLVVVTEERITDSSIDDPLDGDLVQEHPEVRVAEIVCDECGESTDLPPGI